MAPAKFTPTRRRVFGLAAAFTLAASLTGCNLFSDEGEDPPTPGSPTTTEADKGDDFTEYQDLDPETMEPIGPVVRESLNEEGE